MKKLLYILLIASFSAFGQHETMLLASQEQFRNEAPPFPPAGTIVTNGGFDTDSGWTKLNGTTIGEGVANIISAGNIGFSSARWVLNQACFPSGDADQVYTVKFRVRQTVGSGSFQMGNAYAKFFDEFIGSSWEEHEVEYTKGSADTRLVVGGNIASDEFEFDMISVVEN